MGTVITHRDANGNLYRKDVTGEPGTGKVCDGTAWVDAPAGASQLPIGFVFISVVSTNPATSLGYGTWSAFGAGRVLVGLDAADPAFDTAEEVGGAKTVAGAGTNSAPTFTGSALGTHAHGAGTLLPNAHSGAAVADHAAHTHSVTSNVAVNDHAAGVTGAASAGAQAKGSTASTLTLGAHTHTTPALVHGVTNNAVTSGNPSATLTHGVTQPAAHTMAGTSEAVSAGTPAGTVGAPAFTGSPTSVVQPYIVCYFWKRTA